MKIAVIGGGFTGLSAAYELLKKGHKVTVFEKEKQLGGLAIGWKEKHWQWSLERGYHHWFTNDTSIFSLTQKLGLKDKLIIRRPTTAVWWKNHMYPFDSPGSLLAFPGLSFIDKLRTGALMAALKLNPFWQPLEGITAQQLFISIGGKTAWQTIWEPLLIGKFGDYAPTVAASWLWARIKKRTPSLAYMEGGFQTLVDALARAIRKRGGVIKTGVTVGSRDISSFDRTLLTIPTPIAAKLFPNISLPLSIPHLHAHVLILETKKPILNDVYPAPGGKRCGVYWLNVTDRSFPFLAVVAHTNFMDKRHYGGHHITYIGNYLPQGHKHLSMNKKQLLKQFLPFIKRLNPSFHLSDLQICHLFIGYYAQPVHQLHYSRIAPKLTTPIKGVYLANLDSIYPWDRGTNYAVELGIKAAKIIAGER